MKIDQANLPRILQFVRVVERGSINKAAAELRLTQPALTRNMKKLEQSLGVPLIDRSSRGVKPTVCGELLVQHARTIRTTLEQAMTDIELVAGNRDRAIRIGATPFAASRILSVAAPAFQREFPNIRVRAVDGTRPNLLMQLRSGELDIVVTTVEGTIEADLVETILYSDRTSLWVCSSHRLAHIEAISRSDVASEMWVLPVTESTYRSYVDGELRRAGIEIRGSVIETSSPQIIRSLLLNGRVAALPAPVWVTAMEEGAIVALRGEWQFNSRRHALYMRAISRQSAAVHVMVRNIREVAASLNQYPEG